MNQQDTTPAETGDAQARGGSVWERFRAEREARGLSAGDVCAFLKLTMRQIEALESGDIAALPGAAFARGFVRNYARFLELDPAPFLAAIDARIPEVRSHSVESITSNQGLGKMPTRRGSRFSALPAALISIALLAVLSAGWYFQWFEPREEKALLAAASNPVAAAPESVPAAVAPAAVSTSGSAPVSVPVSAPALVEPPPPAMQNVPAPVAVAQSVAPAPLAQAQSAPPAAQSKPAVAPVPLAAASSVTTSGVTPGGMERLVFSFEGEAWVEVRDSTDKVIFSRLNQPGSTQEVQGSAPFKLVVGNARNVKLSWKGKQLDLSPYVKVSVARLTVQ